MISGPANDDCGAATTPIVPATAAAALVKNERRSDSPPLTEKAAADEMHKRRVMAEKKDFMVLVLTLAADYERTKSKEIVDMVKKFKDADAMITPLT